MPSIGLTPEAFKQLPKDGSQFEALICHLLESMGYRILQKPAIGTEGGCDVLVERCVGDKMIEAHEQVIVQCKHYAHSGKAVRDRDIEGWQSAMNRYQARGYLLVTDTRVTQNINRAFRGFTDDDANNKKWATFWDVDQLIALLNQQDLVRETFFPSGVLQTWIGERIAGSPFGFEALLKAVKRSILTAGQNLNHLTRSENESRYRTLILDALRRGVAVQFMLCDLDVKDAVNAWQSVVGKDYRNDLEHSTTRFRSWLKDANRAGLSGLDIRQTALVPVTISFVDPDEQQGRLVFIPVVYHPEAAQRPCFSIVRDDQPRVFDYYWQAYKKVFKDAKRLSRVV